MDAVTLALAKNHTNEQVIQKATNSPTETISFDCGAYSLPSTVVNGQVSVVVKGNSLTVFGDAIALDSDGDGLADNWTQLGTTYSYDTTEKAQLVNCRYNNVHLQRNVGTPLIAGHVYAHLFELKKTSSTMSELHIGIGTNAGGVSQNRVTILNADYNETNYVRVCKKFTFSTVAVMNNTVYFSGYNGTPCNAKIRKYNLIDLTAHGLDDLSEVEILSMIPYWLPTGTKSTNSVRVKSVGKNVYNKDTDFYSGGIESGGAFYSNATGYTLKHVRVKPNTQYTISASSIDRNSFIFHDYNKNSTITYSLPITNNAITFTTPDSCYYMSAYINNDRIVNNVTNVQLEQGTTATEYEPYKESIVNVNLPEPLRSLPNGVKDEVRVSEGKLIKRVSESIVLDHILPDWNWIDGTSLENTYLWYGNIPNRPKGTPVIVEGIPVLHAFLEDRQGIYIGSDINIRLNKSEVGGSSLAELNNWLKDNPITLIYQLATPIVTKLPAQAPLQVFENGTVYVEPIGDASESTLPSVEMTIPTGTSNKFGVATHNYGGAAADWVLTNSESKCFLLAVSSAGGSANIIAPDAPGVMYAISNASGYAITIKKSGGNGVAVTNAKTVLVIHNGTDYTALTAEL